MSETLNHTPETNIDRVKQPGMNQEQLRVLEQNFDAQVKDLIQKHGPTTKDLQDPQKVAAFAKEVNDAITVAAEKTMPGDPEAQHALRGFLRKRVNANLKEVYKGVEPSHYSLPFEKQVSEMSEAEVRGLDAFIREEIGKNITENPHDVKIEIYVSSSPEWSAFGKNTPLTDPEVVLKNKELSEARVAEYKAKLTEVLTAQGIPPTTVAQYVNAATITIDNQAALTAALAAGYTTVGDLMENETYAATHRRAEIRLVSKSDGAGLQIDTPDETVLNVPPAVTEAMKLYTQYDNVVLLVDTSPSAMRNEDNIQDNRRDNRKEAADLLNMMALYSEHADMPTVHVGQFAHQNEVPTMQKIEGSKTAFRGAAEGIEESTYPVGNGAMYKETGVASAFAMLRTNEGLLPTEANKPTLVQVMTDEGEYLNGKTLEEARGEAVKLLHKAQEMHKAGVHIVLSAPVESKLDDPKDIAIHQLNEVKIIDMVQPANEAGGGFEINWWK